MKKFSEGNKMFFNVMAIFVVFAIVVIIFEDYERNYLHPLDEVSDWHLLLFSFVIMLILGALLHRYSRRMDERISREQAEKQNEMRRELTQNIAHELKTPVACILAYSETLRNNPSLSEDKRQMFINRTYAQAFRMTALLQDLSTLNRMEYAPTQLAMEPIDVAGVFKTVCDELAITLNEHHITVDNGLPTSLVLTGNDRLLYSVFRNLMENAVAYAGDGTTVSLKVSSEKGRCHFIFSDNGIGVDDAHLPRLFERFYRIDKSRSRRLGGTGLGLAIVKNAIQFHGGTITASNNQPHGLRFDFTLPQ